MSNQRWVVKRKLAQRLTEGYIHCKDEYDEIITRSRPNDVVAKLEYLMERPEEKKDAEV